MMYVRGIGGTKVYLAVIRDIALGLQCQASIRIRHASLKATAASHLHQVHCVRSCHCPASQVAYRPHERYLQAAQEAA